MPPADPEVVVGLKPLLCPTTPQTDKGGTIDKNEMTAAIMKLNPKATPEMIENLWKYADDDGSVSRTQWIEHSPDITQAHLTRVRRRGGAPC